MNIWRALPAAMLLCSMIGVGFFFYLFTRAAIAVGLQESLTSDGFILFVVCSVFAGCFGFLLRIKKSNVKPSSSASSKPGETASSGPMVLPAGTILVSNGDGNSTESIKINRLQADTVVLLPSAFGNKAVAPGDAAQPALSEGKTRRFFKPC